MEKICQNCRYFKKWSSVEEDSGNCHRYPPQLAPSEKTIFIHPKVRINDWCGEWEEIESMDEAHHD